MFSIIEFLFQKYTKINVAIISAFRGNFYFSFLLVCILLVPLK